MTDEAITLAEWQEDIRGDKHKIVAIEIEGDYQILKMSRRYTSKDWSVDNSWRAIEMPVLGGEE